MDVGQGASTAGCPACQGRKGIAPTFLDRWGGDGLEPLWPGPSLPLPADGGHPAPTPESRPGRLPRGHQDLSGRRKQDTFCLAHDVLSWGMHTHTDDTAAGLEDWNLEFFQLLGS